MNKFIADRNSTNCKMGLLPPSYHTSDDMDNTTPLVISPSCDVSPLSSSVKVLQYSHHDGTTFGVYGKNSPLSSPAKTPSVHSCGTTDSSTDSLLYNKGKLSFGSDDLSCSSGHSSGDEADYRCDMETKPDNNTYKYLQSENSRTLKSNGLKYTNLTFTDVLINGSAFATPRGGNNAQYKKLFRALPKPAESGTPRTALSISSNVKLKSNSPPQIEGVRIDKRVNTSTNLVSTTKSYTSKICLNSSFNSNGSTSSSTNSGSLMLFYGSNDVVNPLSQINVISRTDRLSQQMPPESHASTIPTIRTLGNPDTLPERRDTGFRRGRGIEGQLGELLPNNPSRLPISISKSVKETRSNTVLITPRSIRPVINHGMNPLLNTQPRSRSKTDDLLIAKSFSKVDTLLKQSNQRNDKPDELVPFSYIPLLKSRTEDMLHIKQLAPTLARNSSSDGSISQFLRPASLMQFSHQSNNDQLRMTLCNQNHKFKSKSIVAGRTTESRLRKKSCIISDTPSTRCDLIGSNKVTSVSSYSKISSATSPESPSASKNIKYTSNDSRGTSSFTVNYIVYEY